MINLNEPYISESDASTLEGQSIPTTIRVVQEGDNGVYEHNDINVWEQGNVDEILLAALKDATRYIDSYDFVGEKSEQNQELKFPRHFQEEVPDEVKLATHRIAREMLRQHYIENGFPTLMVQPMQVDATDFYSQTAQSQTSIQVEGEWEEKLYKLFHRYLGKYRRGNYPVVSMSAIYQRPTLTTALPWAPGDGRPHWRP